MQHVQIILTDYFLPNRAYITFEGAEEGSIDIEAIAILEATRKMQSSWMLSGDEYKTIDDM